MYVREKKIRRGEKTYSYWQVVRSTRVDGKPRQTFVKHLGPLPGRPAALVVAKKWGVMCGVEDCTKEGEEERPVRSLGKDRRLGKGRRSARLLLCSEHASHGSAGGTIHAVALNREWPGGG